MKLCYLFLVLMLTRQTVTINSHEEKLLEKTVKKYANVKHSKYSVSFDRPGLITISTNTRPNYMTPELAGYPLERHQEFNIPRYPIYGENITCVPTDEPLGVTIYGTLIYSVALPKPGCPQVDESRYDNKVKLDPCGGTSDINKYYRVYNYSLCLQNLTCSQPSSMIGIAFDGFPIYGPIDEDGQQLTSSQLDECHGKVAKNGEYRYHATIDYPYFVGCYKGILHRDVGITYPVICTCPYDDTLYLHENRIEIPYSNYTIGYEWRYIYRYKVLFPCKTCTDGHLKHNNNKTSWLDYNNILKKVKKCNMTSQYRLIPVLERSLIDGRLPPAKEAQFYQTLQMKEDLQSKFSSGSENSSNQIDSYTVLIFHLLLLIILKFAVTSVT